MIDLRIETKGADRTTKALKQFPALVARARRSALSSTGHRVRQDLKEEGRRIEPKLNPHTGILAVTHETAQRRGRDVTWGTKRKKGTGEWVEGSSRSRGKGGLVARKLSSRLEPFSRFVNMVRYRIDMGDHMVEVGILKPKPIYFNWFRKNVAGFDTHVSPKMRRFLFAVGFPIRKETTVLRTPARPWIDKVREKWDRQGGPFFEMQFWNALNRYRSKGLKAS